MVIDTSAVLAILFQEDESPAFARTIEYDRIRLFSAVTVFEASVVMESRRGELGVNDLDRLLAAMEATVEPFAPADVALARAAFHKYGKGRHRAALNFGDCFSYVLASSTGEPLLFKGQGFIHTDIEQVVVR